MTPEERSLRARIAVHIMWSRTPDRAARTRPARDNGPAAPSDSPYWLNKVDPDGRMSETDRLLAAESARKTYYLRLVKKGVAARRKGERSP
ncbi:MAG: hypothetical protein GEV11_26890 [Streptosporangiales bacterium]|nr:hypothetical protein [Streptosporangiales bacterium]